MQDLLLTYYGDDLTGSTDALEFLSKAGARTVLFTRPPSSAMMSRYRGLQAFGIAGTTRCLPPDAMKKELSEAFNALRAFGPPHIHYKVCSTFDSSPEVGSIGCAIDVGRRVVGSSYVPLLVGAPALGRYCAFGNLFAATEIGGSGQVFRLDRHPTASKHPITPMEESDLRVHLSKQSDAEVALFDLLKLDLPAQHRLKELDHLVTGGADVVLFDVLYERHLQRIGSLLDVDATATQPQFSVGSSGIEMALCAHWIAEGKLTPRVTWAAPKRATQVLVVSGSCSPVTHSQIDWASKNGFAEVAIDTPAIVDPETSSHSMERSTRQVIEALKSGKSVVVHTSKGNTDSRISATTEVLAGREADGKARKDLSGRLIGVALGHLVRTALEETSLRRICIAGGDTASFVAKVLRIEAIEMLCPLGSGSPLCSVYAPDSVVDGLEVNFKGGQVGKEDFFGSLLEGTIQPSIPTYAVEST